LPRVVGIDPGTSTWGFCGIEFESSVTFPVRVFLDVEMPTNDWKLVREQLEKIIDEHNDLIVGPSGYGIPLKRLDRLSDLERDLMLLNIGKKQVGVRDALSILERRAEIVVLLPGVKHLPTVPKYRKINRVDMGTADKVCAVAFALTSLLEQDNELPDPKIWPSFIHCELGFGFNAFIGVESGRIVDGIGGSYSTLGFSGGGALDSELAFLLGRIPKKMIYRGGIRTIGYGNLTSTTEKRNEDKEWLWDAFLEGVLKDIARVSVSVPKCSTFVLSGHLSKEESVRMRLKEEFPDHDICLLKTGGKASTAAYGAAYLGNGLKGGIFASIFRRLMIAESSGSVLDYLAYQPDDEKAPLRVFRQDAH